MCVCVCVCVCVVVVVVVVVVFVGFFVFGFFMVGRFCLFVGGSSGLVLM